MKIKCDFKGEKNGNVKLTDKEIKKIRKEWESENYTLRQIATRYGISHGHVYRIVKRIQR